jgi:protein-tyrosine phosphatase
MSTQAGRQPGRIAVLFVCHGNICRSPLAEGVFKHLVAERGLERRFHVDSAGTYALDGQFPHPLSVRVAEEHGIALASVSRGLVRDDLWSFDHIVAMDRANEADLLRLCRLAASDPAAHQMGKVRLLRTIATSATPPSDPDVPDPILAGPEGFAATYEIIEQGCRALLDELE